MKQGRHCSFLKFNVDTVWEGAGSTETFIWFIFYIIYALWEARKLGGVGEEKNDSSTMTSML